MPPLHRIALAIPVATLSLAALAPAAPAQSRPVARYLVAPDTLRYELDNPYRMYWMRGADTLGDPRHEHSVETHQWRGTVAAPEVVIRSVSLDVNLAHGYARHPRAADHWSRSTPCTDRAGARSRPWEVLSSLRCR